MDNKGKVLLTGVNGFLGSHAAIQLLERGYEVIGTLRQLKNADETRRIIGNYTKNIDSLQLVEADLMDETVWEKLTAGVDYVQHIASPFPEKVPDNEDELIQPALKGTLNVLKAAAANHVRRTVITSSLTAIIYGRKGEARNGTFDETQWTNTDTKEDITAYFKSKTLAEQAAWEFMLTDKSGMKLTTVCPAGIIGPVLENYYSLSVGLVTTLMDEKNTSIPNVGYDIIDVRSVADLLIKAMESPRAAGQRYIATAGYLTMHDMGQILQARYPDRAIHLDLIPDQEIFNKAKTDKNLGPLAVNLGSVRKVSNAKAISQLGWEPISNKESLIDTAESLLERSLIQ